MQQLKELLATRENRWTKLLEREQEQRANLSKLGAELKKLSLVANNRKLELEAKTEALNVRTFTIKLSLSILMPQLLHQGCHLLTNKMRNIILEAFTAGVITTMWSFRAKRPWSW